MIFVKIGGHNFVKLPHVYNSLLNNCPFIKFRLIIRHILPVNIYKHELIFGISHYYSY